MYLPSEPLARFNLVSETLQKCLASRKERQNRYHQYRQWYLYGTDTNTGCRFNKIQPTIRRKTSLLYAQESTRFAINPGPSVHPDEAEKCEVGARLMDNHWRDNGIDDAFAQATEWAEVYGSMFVKLLPRNKRYHAMLVEPGNFGVLREDIPLLDNQEAFVHCFSVPKAELERVMTIAQKSPEDIRKVLDRVSVVTGADEPITNNFVGRLLISQSQPAMVGVIQSLSNTEVSYEAMVKEELAEGYELWIWDDAAEDYQVITLVRPEIVIFDRPAKKLFAKQRNPFIPVIPNPLYNYFWGESDVTKLIPLQAWREQRVSQLDKLFERQATPPAVFTGFTGVVDEKAAAMWRKGGSISSQLPQAKAELLNPTVPTNAFAEIEQIDQMFSETIQIPPILTGEGQGLRGEEQANLMAAMAGSPLRRMALNVETCVENGGDLLLALMRQEDAQIAQTEEGEPFIPAMLPKDVEVTVASHSSSPVFAHTIRTEANEMLKLGVIDPQTYVELTDPPMSQLIIERLKKREKQQAQQEQGMMQAASEALQKTPEGERGNVVARLIRALTDKKSR